VKGDSIDNVIQDFWRIKRSMRVRAPAGSKAPADIDETELRTRLALVVRRYAALTDGAFRGRLIKGFTKK
jgi:hypothetical protein